MTENRGPLEYEIRPKPYGWDGVELVFDFGTRENAEYVAKFMAMALTLAPNAVGCEVMRDFIIEDKVGCINVEEIN